jgi:tetratricopeptide (TPR) repeat protein
LHYRVASYLEEVQKENLDPVYELLVHHYHLSRDYPKTRFYSVKAADKARQVFAHEEAIHYYHIGLNSVFGKGAAQYVERSYFLERIGDCQESSGQHAEGAKTYYQALRQWKRAQRQPIASMTEPPELMNGQPMRARHSVLRHKIAVAYERNSDYDLALKHLEAALHELPPRHPRQAAGIAITKSLTYYRKGVLDQAIHWGKEGLVLSRLGRDRQNLAYAYNMLAFSYNDTGNINKAIRYRQMAISIYEELVDLSGQADARNNLGLCYQSLGNQKEALHHFELTLSLLERMGNPTSAAVVHNNIGEVLLVMSRLDDASDHFQKVVETYKERGDPVGCCGLALVNLSRVYQRKKEYENAFASLSEGVILLNKVGARPQLIEASLQEAELHIETGRAEIAFCICHSALKEVKSLGLKVLEARALRIQGRTQSALGEYVGAETNLKGSITLSKRLSADYERGLSLLALAEMPALGYKGTSPLLKYRHAAKQAEAIFQRMGAKADLKKALQIQSELRL